MLPGQLPICSWITILVLSYLQVLQGLCCGWKRESQAHRKKETLQVRTPSMARSFFSVCLPILVSAWEGRHSQACRGHPCWKFAIEGLPACRDLESASWIRWCDMLLTFLDVTVRGYLRPMVTRRLFKLVCLLHPLANDNSSFSICWVWWGGVLPWLLIVSGPPNGSSFQTCKFVFVWMGDRATWATFSC